MIPAGHFLEKYLFGFYIFGIYLENPFRESKRCYKIAFTVLLKVSRRIHLIFIILMMFQFFREIHNEKQTFVFNSSWVIPIIPNVLMLFNSSFSTKMIKTIFSIILRAENHLKNSIEVPVRLNILEHDIHVKLFFGVIANSAAFFFKMFVFSPIFTVFHDFTRFILVFFKSFAIFLVIVLIDYTTFLIFSLNEKLNGSRSDIFHSNSKLRNVVQIICQIKIVQFRISKLTALINSQFGWFIIASILDNFYATTNNVLIMFVYLVSGSGNWIKFIRKLSSVLFFNIRN